MTLSLNDLGLRPAELKEVERKAKQAGTTASQYVRALIARDLLSDKTFDEMLEPARTDFQRHGTTEDQLTAIVERARKARAPKSPRTRP